MRYGLRSAAPPKEQREAVEDVAAPHTAKGDATNLSKPRDGGVGGSRKRKRVVKPQGDEAAPQIQTPDFNIIGQSSTNQLAEAIGGQTQQPIKAFVVSSDVSTAQELDRNIIESASI